MRLVEFALLLQGNAVLDTGGISRRKLGRDSLNSLFDRRQ